MLTGWPQANPNALAPSAQGHSSWAFHTGHAMLPCSILKVYGHISRPEKCLCNQLYKHSGETLNGEKSHSIK